LSDGKVISTNGASEPLEDAFRRIGTSALEKYSEFVPDGLKPNAVADLYAGKLAMTAAQPQGTIDQQFDTIAENPPPIMPTTTKAGNGSGSRLSALRPNRAPSIMISPWAK
jgi:hypothetical protein